MFSIAMDMADSIYHRGMHIIVYTFVAIAILTTLVTKVVDYFS